MSGRDVEGVPAERDEHHMVVDNPVAATNPGVRMGSTGPMEHYQHLLANGLTPSEVTRQIRSGELISVRRGAFTRPGLITTPEDGHLELIAATVPLLADASVLSHVSAAVLHGLPVPLTTLNQVHVTRPDAKGRATRHTHVHGANLPSEDIVHLRGWRVTSLARTVVDSARWLNYADGVAVVDASLHQGLDPAALNEELVKARRRRNNARARRAVAFGDGRAESAGESRSRVAMAQLGLPMPTLQHEFFRDNGELVARVDFDWEEFGTCGEFDGLVKYGRLLKPGQSAEGVVLYEKQREESLRERGRWVIRWIHTDLKDLRRFRRIVEAGFRYGSTGNRRRDSG